MRMNKSCNHLILNSVICPAVKQQKIQGALLINHKIHESVQFSGSTILEIDSDHLFAISDDVNQSYNLPGSSRTFLKGLYESWKEITETNPNNCKEFINYLQLQSINYPAMLVGASFNDQSFTIFNSGNSKVFLIDTKSNNQLTRDNKAFKLALKEKNVNVYSLHNDNDQYVAEKSHDSSSGIHVSTTGLQPGQFLLLCSHGSESYLSQEEIMSHFLSLEEYETKTHQLAQQAIDNGAENNISIICVSYPTIRELKLMGYIEMGQAEKKRFIENEKNALNIFSLFSQA
jgi:serine/threonine protein phosphatase PrpC